MKVVASLCVIAVASIAGVLSINKCSLVRCAYVSLEQCRNNSQAFIRGDGEIHCCNYCQDIDEAIDLDRSKCNPEDCWTVRCARLPEDSCKKGQALIPSDQNCFCCDACVDLKTKKM